jgi:hypothetical protein
MAWGDRPEVQWLECQRSLQEVAGIGGIVFEKCTSWEDWEERGVSTWDGGVLDKLTQSPSPMHRMKKS